MKNHALSKMLKKDRFPKLDEVESERELDSLQLRMLRVQQGIWHNKKRAIILFEGFDAAGKGGSIRRLVEKLDPRGVRVFSFGPPTADEQGRHFFYRFFKALPRPGCISIFDRTWYGRVLVERVMKLTPKDRWKEAYEEINFVEKMLVDDGIDIVKIFLGISREEQRRRFEERIADPYKQWKITPDDIKARKHWNAYVEAADEMLAKTDKHSRPWALIPADDKPYARVEVLKHALQRLHPHADWLERKILHHQAEKMKKALKKADKE